MNEADERWERNYFNYFTEVEEHFQRARGTGLFLLSPLDWALIESWKNAGIPLLAVLRGIDAAFAKWHERRQRGRMVNSLAYCAQAVIEEAQTLAGQEPAEARQPAAAPFSIDDLRRHLENAARQIRETGDPEYQSVAAAVEQLLLDVEAHYAGLEELEQRLTALEDKLVAIARARQSEEELFAARRELDRQLRPYRGRMTASQLAMLEKQYLDRHLLESARLPRLSLFYVR